MRIGGDVDDSCRRARPQAVQEQQREEKVREMVHGEDVLDAVDGDLPRQLEHPGVVDEDVQRPVTREKARRQIADRLLRREIGDEHLGGSAGFTNLARERVAARGIASDEKYLCSQPRELERRHAADAGGRPRDEAGFAVQGPVGHGGPLWRPRCYFPTSFNSSTQNVLPALPMC